MIVVADTSPLILLWKIQSLSLLHALYGHVVIPDTVKNELAGTSVFHHGAELIDECSDWLIVQNPTTIDVIKGLDHVESAAIALAQEINADFLIVDERAGRRAAKQRGLRIIGTIGILEDAARQGLIDLGAIFERVKLTNFRYPHALLDKRLVDFQKSRL